MKYNCTKNLALLFIILLLSGCFLFPKTATIRVYNNTADEVEALISIDGATPDSLGIPTPESFEEFEVEFPTGTESLSVDVVISGILKLEENSNFTLTPDDIEILSIDPDAGAIAFDNYGYDNLPWVWLMPNDPTTYSTRAEVESDAAYAIENLGAGDYTTLTCRPGIYYVLIQANDGYYYQTETVVVSANEHGNVDCNLSYAHPSLSF
ncbi:MAG: hypothetical protein PQJ58_09875 [Spirochaetales bacterium]|nr:hypothetical protein [Spirochaetales bacterium]